jgi:prepilin-type N-terminal cleavage/methylation domain-containing protein
MSLDINNTSSYKNKKAFSFVEIIIVISIIALLSVMALTYYNGHTDKSINAKVESDIATINNSLLYYIQENQSLPAP